MLAVAGGMAWVPFRGVIPVLTGSSYGAAICHCQHLKNKGETMKITMIATEKLTQINGVQARLWEGITEQGVKCKVFVHRVLVHKSEDSTQFEKELIEKMPGGVVYNLKYILLGKYG